MKFSAEELRLALYEDSHVLEHINDEFVESGRWSEHRYFVFKHEGTLYGVNYSQGLTEQQDERPFEYDGDQIECDEVERVEVVKYEYVPKKK